MKPQNTQNRQKKNLELNLSASFACSAVLHYFDQISEAPDAIPRLRRFILDLAVRGKLVEQNPDDEPAWELVKRIKKEKDWLTKDGQLLKSKLKKSENYDNLPHETPSKWKWCHLSELSLRIHYGYTASANRNLNDIRLLRITDIQNNVVHWDSVPGCDITKNHVDQYLLSDGDILIARTGGTIGKSFLVKAIPVKAVFASYLIRVQNSQEYLDRYLKLFLESSTYWDQLESGSRGTGQPNVNGQTLGNMKVPLPPLAEQHRIVAKVDELMELCDELEAAQQKRESRRDRLITASLGKLTDETDNKTILNFSISSACSAVSRLEHIQQLRKTILNLAVRGKLVPQDPKDEPVKYLISQVEAERKHRINQGESVSEQTFTVTNENGFQLPRSWVWAKLGFVTNVLMGQSPPGDTYNIRGEGIPLINGPVEFSQGPFGTTILNQYTTAPSKLCRKGDLLLCVRGSTTGRTNIAGFDACIGRGVAALQPMYDDHFVRLFVWSWREKIIEMGRGIAFPSVQAT